MNGGDQQHDHHCSELVVDFAFAFNNPSFSDRILKLLIYDDLPAEKSENRSTKDAIRPLQQRKEDIQESSNESRVISLNICSAILAAKSPFFEKLFTNGMKACNQHEVSLRIFSSEEAALMDVLKFMHNSNLVSANTPNALLEMLLTADKFDVPSCVNYCCKLLLSFTMTADLAILYIELLSNLSTNVIQPLLSAAKGFLPNILKDIPRYHKDIINLPLEGIKTVLSSDDLKVDSEDAAYDLLVEWSKQHFPDPEERCKVLKAEMFNLIRLQYMSPQKLKSVFADLYSDVAATSMVGAIFHDESKPLLPRHRRAYNFFPLVVITFEIPVRQCVVFFDLKREECRDITIRNSQTFVLYENIFYLSVRRFRHESGVYTFGLFLNMKTGKNKSAVAVEYHYFVRKKYSHREFVEVRPRITHTFKSGNDDWGYKDLFGITWDAAIAEGSNFLINGTMHFRVDVTLVD